MFTLSFKLFNCYYSVICFLVLNLIQSFTDDERVYLIVKAVVRLSHPAPMDMVLRKRLAVNIYKKQSLTSKFVKSFIGSTNTLYETGIMYEVVSNIPKVRE